MTSGKKNNSIVVDGRRGWIIVFASFMIHFIMDGITYSMGQVFLEPMRNELGLPRAPVSSIFSILSAVTLATGPIASVFIDKYGCRFVTVAGACLASLGFFLSRWWANVWFYHITIGVIGGLGFSLMYMPAIVSINMRSKDKRAFAMGIATSGSGVGTFVFAYIMDGLVNKHSWLHYSNALLVEAVVILFVIFCGLMMPHTSQPATDERPIEQNPAAEKMISSNAPAVQPATKSFVGQITEQLDLKLLLEAPFTLYVISNFLASLGFNAVYNYADDLANDSRVIKDQRTYIIMSIGLTNIAGRICVGRLGDKVDRLMLFILVLVMSGLATMVAPLSGSSVIPHIAYASLFGFFSGGNIALTPVVLVDIVGEERELNGLGVLFFFIGIANFIGTPFAGAMRDAFANFTRPFLWPYVILGACAFVGGIIPCAIMHSQRKKSKKQSAKIKDADPV